MIIYGVYWESAYGDEELQNMFTTPEKAEAYIQSRKAPQDYFVTEMQVY